MALRYPATLDLETAAVFVFLRSEAAVFVSGATHRADGAASKNTSYRIPDHKRFQPLNGFHPAVKPKVFD